MQGDHVRIGGIGTLTSAVAAHRDEHDVRPYLSPPLGFLPLRDSEGSEDCGIRGVSNRVPARIDAAQQVTHRATCQLARADGADTSGSLGRVVMTVDEGSHLSGQPMRLARCQLVIIVEPGHSLGTLGEGLGDPARVRKHGRQPVGGHTRVT